jgi:pimeloyl-ACP methyl ester carboxylesterase
MSTPTVTPHYEGGEGPPLVLLHGIQATWTAWKPVLPALEQRHAVFAPTIAGHRGAEPLPDGTRASALTLTDALERGLDAAGIETAHFAGNSLGGWLALELARRGRARSVTAISPAGAFTTPKDLKRVVKMLGQARSMSLALGPRLGPLIRRPRGRRLLLRMVSERGDRVPAAAMAELFEDLAACTIFEDFVASIGADGGIAPGVDASGTPIRIAWAEHDRTIPFERYGRPMLDLVPGAEHITLPGVGHVPMYDDPELVARTILEVTERAERSASAAATAPTPDTTKETT